MTSNNAATIISGVGPLSLGAALATELCVRHSVVPLIAVDKHLDAKLNKVTGLHGIEIDLNPLRDDRPYCDLSTELGTTMTALQKQLRFTGFETAVLSAGTYDAGALVSWQAESRIKVLGVNVCGKIELLHSILKLNEISQFDSPTRMTLIDIGSSHGIDLTAGRSLYAASKAFGLNLCLSLSKAKEINRVIHIAPGPIDTHMLHRNHWIVKCGGSPEFFDNIRSGDERRYRDIFVECDQSAFEDAASDLSLEHTPLTDVFDRYRTKRHTVLQEGVLTPNEVATLLSEIVQNKSDYASGLYLVSSSHGRLTTDVRAFSSLEYR